MYLKLWLRGIFHIKRICSIYYRVFACKFSTTETAHKHGETTHFDRKPFLLKEIDEWWSYGGNLMTRNLRQWFQHYINRVYCALQVSTKIILKYQRNLFFPLRWINVKSNIDSDVTNNNADGDVSVAIVWSSVRWY